VMLRASPPGLVNLTDALGRSPLHEASMSGSRKATQVLLMSGAQADALDSFGLSPRDYALQEGHSDVADSIGRVEGFSPGIAGLESLEWNGLMPPAALELLAEEDAESFTSIVIGSVVGLVAGLSLLVSVAVCWARRGGGRAEVKRLPRDWPSAEEDMADPLRQGAKGQQRLCDGVDEGAQAAPPGGVVEAGGGSEHRPRPPKADGRGSWRRPRRPSVSDEPEQPVIVIASQQTPKASSGDGRRHRCADGPPSSEGEESSPRRHVAGRGDYDSDGAEGLSWSRLLAARRRGQGIDEDLKGQLRAELRSKEDLGSRQRSQSSPTTSPSCAAVKRISTPPMATGDPGSGKSHHEPPPAEPRRRPREPEPGARAEVQRELRHLPRDGSKPRGKTKAKQDDGRDVSLPAALRGL